MKLLILLMGVSVALALPPIGPINCIKNCECKDLLPNMLSVLSCNRSLTLNSQLFDHLDNQMKVMKFSGVIIDEIKEDAFQRFPLLEDVIIEHAQIGSVDQRAFDTIKKVQFADCGFEDEPVLWSKEMEELHFGNCKLDKIPPMANLMGLKFLNLSGNYIRDVSVTDFAELFSLETLYLSDNELSRIVGDVFVNNVEMYSLYLDNNPLKLFALNTSNSLETLSLKNCFLTSFSLASSQRLSSLRELNLHNNRINNLQAKDLSPLTSLEVIDLSNNSLNKLDNDIFSGNSNLQKVILDGNKLETLPNFTLVNGTKFEIYLLSCKGCELKHINSDVFKNMPAIVTLNLSYNNLTYINDMLKYIRSLATLDLSFNKIKLTLGDFDNNRDLESIFIAGNPIEKLSPELFRFNQVLKKLDASNCSLVELWTNNTGRLSSLSNLYLANNELVTLSVADFKVVPKLRILDLHNNPLMFDDVLCRATNYLKNKEVTLVENSQIKKPEMIDSVDNFTPDAWDKLLNGHCLDVITSDDDSEELNSSLEDYISELNLWNKRLDDENDKDDDIDDDDDEDDDDEDDSAYDDDDDEDSEIGDYFKTEYSDGKLKVGAVEEENVNLAKVSYILSLTSVFVLTALSVLIMAVVITLCVLRRNNNFNMHRANLPRFKIIPRLQSHFEKNHSGSIYKPLSEEAFPGPETPKVKRYEFPTVNPTVHTNP